MSDDLFICMASCQNANNSGALVGNDSYDLECITQCSQLYTTLYQHTSEKYASILQIIAVVLITLGLIGKVFNCIIFLRKPLRGTSTGLLLFLKTIFDFVPLLWTFVFDTKFFVQDEHINASRIICALSRSSEIFISWSIGFVILACTIRLVNILHSKYLPRPTRLRVFVLIIIMMICGIMYNWHLFYYPSLVKTTITDHKNRTFTYCNVFFGRQIGYFSFGGFQSTQELGYNAPIVNFIVSSLIPFAIVSSTNIVIILRVIMNTDVDHIVKSSSNRNGQCSGINRNGLDNELSNSLKKKPKNITKKYVNNETTITLTTSCVFLTTNSIASIYVYVKSSYRPDRSDLAEDIKTTNVYLILRMLTLIDTVLEFYIYFLTGKKFRQEVYNVIKEILQYTPLRHFFKLSRIRNSNANNRRQEKNLPCKTILSSQPLQQKDHTDKNDHLQYSQLVQLTTSSETRTSLKEDNDHTDSSRHTTPICMPSHNNRKTALDRIESTV